MKSSAIGFSDIPPLVKRTVETCVLLPAVALYTLPVLIAITAWEYIWEGDWIP